MNDLKLSYNNGLAATSAATAAAAAAVGCSS